jgi:glutathione S-transferase
LVSAGVTAVIGMRRIVDLYDTDRFCKALYPEVLAAIDDAAASAGDQPTGEAVLDWASALTSPRKVMSGADPSAADAWLDPVLYVQNDELRVFRATPHLSPAEYAQLQGKRDKYLEFLAAVDPLTTDQGVIDDVRLLLTQTETRLAEAGG